MAGVNISRLFCRSLLRQATCRSTASTIRWPYRGCAAVNQSAPRCWLSTAPDKQAEDTGAGDKAEATEPLTDTQLQEQIAKLTKEKETLAEQLLDYKDKYQRTLADRENVRLRLEKQILDAKQFGIQGFCKDLLEVSDVFRKAIESVTPESVKFNADLRTLYDGLIMTENQLLSVFRRHGLAQITPEIGEKFDPSLQEAMFELTVADKEPGTVAHIVRNGWTLHSRCIRSAQVGVVKD